MTNEKSLKGTTCKTKIRNGWHSYTCGKPAKGFLEGGEPACGIHLRAEKRREEAQIKFDLDWKDAKEFHAEVAAFCAEHPRLSENSLQVRNRETRTVQINFDELKALIKKS